MRNVAKEFQIRVSIAARLQEEGFSDTVVLLNEPNSRILAFDRNIRALTLTTKPTNEQQILFFFEESPF